MSDNVPPTPIPPSRLTLAAAPKEPPRPAPGEEVPPPPVPPPTRRDPTSRRSATPGQGWLLRTVMALLFVGSVALVLWSHRRLVPVQQESRKAAEKVSQLSGEIAVMQGRYSSREVEELAKRFEQTRSLLFPTPEDLFGWFGGLQTNMIPLALEARADFRPPAITNTAGHKLAVVPARLTLVLKPTTNVAGVNTPYERVLRFLDELTGQEKRVDLVELEVSGGTNSVSQASASIDLWAGEEIKP